MKKEIIKTIIDGLDSTHPLKKHSCYVDVLVDCLEEIEDCELEKIKTLLCGKTTYDKFVYNQGVSELFLYFLFSKQERTFEVEKKMVSGNNHNVDISIEDEEYTYNFEVKSPKYLEPKVDDGTMKLRCVHRFDEKEKSDTMMQSLIEEIKPNLEEAGYSDCQKIALTDNKTKDCLLSAQEKFPVPSSTNCNVLFICTTTSEFVNYIEYFCNKSSGFFTKGSDVSSFLDFEKNPLTHDHYNKVNAVILSNAITLNERRNTLSWDLNNALNLVLINPDSIASGDNQNSITNLLSFFPNCNDDYKKECILFYEDHEGFPFLTFLLDFVAKKGYGLNS